MIELEIISVIYPYKIPEIIAELCDGGYCRE
ncbi:hypothetical protein Asulf_01951 [Archaeoglobus sulfaticallidus PM70-1]|uniref:Uncharacterized protein n=1 Tax=Archaeoglobus sulfaticallidus PM70-1 TaxID=387631 RepID=N0BHY7_9EURY|nr:hypothetical protein Asulf_01951 [Archaeoglobus sulfaticallidus PM70-1]